MDDLKSIIGNVDTFLENIFSNLNKINLKTDNYFLDHLCYRTASQEEYQQKKAELLNLGELFVEAPVNGRLIATFKFFTPVEFKGRNIPMIELPSPKPGKNYQSGLEHVEFVINESLQSFIERFSVITFETDNIADSLNPDVKISFADGLTVKFHIESLDKIIEKEKALMGIE